MTRPIDPKRREELLERAAAYVESHGSATLSLRPLAAAIGSSPRGLLYHFGSKEGLIAATFARLRARQQARLAAIDAALTDDPAAACRAIWNELSSPHGLALFRRFVETLAHALNAEAGLEDFLRASIHDWLAIGQEQRLAAGATLVQSQTFATILIAGFRGFLLDLASTGERERVDRAVAAWLVLLDAFPFGEPSS